MKLHTNLTEREVRECLARAQASGDVPADIKFDLFAETGSRSHAHGYDVHLATERRDTRADSVTRKTAAYYGTRGQLKAASYDEWGAFLAELFSADEDAHARPYKGKDDFHAKTDYNYATRDDLPADAPAQEPYDDEPEPYREPASTAATTRAMLSPDETVARIDDTLAYWRNDTSPA